MAKRLERDGQPNRSLRIPAERWRFRIRGLVQGVGYRAGCCRRAQELGLAGWVRNCSDGSVEVQAEGDEQRLTELRVWCEGGPPGARVDSVDGSRVATTGADWFEIRPNHFQGGALTR
ncbi:MAG: acylphosphatase [Synechococcus sp. MED-G67]|uniref:Acylphosphatase n=1 Tax=Synechococcus sp. (strain RCC307) TaxID=316278 RepID=ACYP_SYNR3|nr:RecName: Full=Acylphosphatase; AltName: Full=Acylphosphate phosphohydrolase [Synechococcus sp. RCC307]MEC8604448.1 acylphosphatase [Cyanobacteriota bacterium]NBQ37732.1 acylphosphatase [Synechococcus sp.]OUW41188.1 MAG: acylphosphatase [Synechococcus sp. TMED185]RCL61814.1 MAG: acylphosphatase [Synechococcus sp. MED-G67]HCA62130.1 acylphosphatase [Synechococcales bacterium UBA8647]